MAAKPAAGRKPGRPKDPDRETRRKAEIPAAAAEEFAAAGYAATDVQAIADRIGVGKGTVYRYFPTKRELFLAAVDRGLEDLSAEIDAVVDDPARDPLDQLSGAVAAYLGFFHRRPEMVELFIQERAEFRDRHTPRYFANQAEKHAGCRDVDFVKKLVTDGRFRAVDPHQLITVVGDLLYGTVMSNRLSGRPADPAAQAAAILDIVLRGVLAPGRGK